ncbi:MAG: SOS response-associated peptidase, partial [Rhizobiaceae bacterium]|nr:SOS response-associated peptidase [Rhizobiaceae bacterium]
MCGRFTLTATPREVADLLSLAEIEDFPPRYNIAPTQPILVILGGTELRPDANRSGREARLVRWGFVPGWVKDLKTFPLLFNARSETAAGKNAFKAAMKYRRCLVPASGFYEWRRDAAGKTGQAFFVRPRSGRPLAFAG